MTLVPGATETEDDVMKYLETEGVRKGGITRWMLPDYILITDQIPKTSVGKFDKIAIRQNLDALLGKARKTSGWRE
jgi:non-ribosomal peptide synthetase component E (peptide arylation enzyme)